MSKTIQIGASLSGDLKENTWTFEMLEEISLMAGKFAIVPLDTFEEMAEGLVCARALLQTMGAKTTDEVGGKFVQKIYSIIDKLQS